MLKKRTGVTLILSINYNGGFIMTAINPSNLASTDTLLMNAGPFAGPVSGPASSSVSTTTQVSSSKVLDCIRRALSQEHTYCRSLSNRHVVILVATLALVAIATIYLAVIRRKQAKKSEELIAAYKQSVANLEQSQNYKKFSELLKAFKEQEGVSALQDPTKKQENLNCLEKVAAELRTVLTHEYLSHIFHDKDAKQAQAIKKDLLEIRLGKIETELTEAKESSTELTEAKESSDAQQISNLFHMMNGLLEQVKTHLITPCITQLEEAKKTTKIQA